MKKVLIAYPDGSELNLELKGEEYTKFIDWVENKNDNSFYKVRINNVIHYLYKQNFKYIKVLGFVDDSAQYDEREKTEEDYRNIYDDAIEFC